MTPQGPARYLVNCGLLLLPAIAWNIAFIDFLPPAFGSAADLSAVPAWLLTLEDAARSLVFALPFIMPLAVRSPVQRAGLLVFIAGSALYFASWLPLVFAPQSAWSTHWAGFLAPAYTPALWLAGLALLGQRLFWGQYYRWWLYLLASALFVLVHVGHLALVFDRAHGLGGN